MNNWVKTGVSVGFAAIAVIFSAAFTTTGVIDSNVGAGNGTSKQITNITEFSDALVGVQNMMGGTSSYEAEPFDAEISAEGDNSITAFTLVQSNKAGMSYTLSSGNESVSASMKMTSDTIIAMNQDALYASGEMTLYTTATTSGESSKNVSMQVNAVQDVYIPFKNSEAGTYTTLYSRVRECSIFYKGESYCLSDEVLNKWIKIENSDSFSLSTTASYYALSFETIVDYVTADAANFIKSGNEYTMNKDTFNALMTSAYSAQQLIELGGTIDGSFSVDLSQKTAPEMKLKYSCGYSTSLNGYSVSASGSEKDSWILKNVNNTAINISEADLAANAITEEEFDEYWSKVEWPI